MGSAEDLELISGPDERREVEQLILEVGPDYAEDGLFTVWCQINSGKTEIKVIKTLQGVLRRWIEKGKLIGFRDDAVHDWDDHCTENLANLFFGRRMKMLRQLDYADQICFFDKGFAGSKRAGFPLLVEDFPGGTSYLIARDNLKERFSVSKEYDQRFDLLCNLYGLKRVAHAYTTVRKNWPDGEMSIPESRKFTIVEDRLRSWGTKGVWFLYEADKGMSSFSEDLIVTDAAGHTTNWRDEFAKERGSKVYAVREFHPGNMR